MPWLPTAKVLNMTNYRYKLQTYTGINSRFSCPKCRKTKQFTRYVDLATNEYVADNVGRCNRIDQCGYHYSPKQYFNDFPSNKPIKSNSRRFKLPLVQKVKDTSYIDYNIFEGSLRNYENNNLIQYLLSIFNISVVDELIETYLIGTSKHWQGGTTIFWQVDQHNKVRTGKLIKYSPTTGKRIKKPFTHTNWVHSVLKIEGFNLNQCFFGTHLVEPHSKKVIGIVESEKTAIIAAGCFPNMIWLASGGAETISKERVQPLIGRDVVLFPDASKESKMYRKWESKALEYGFKISTYLKDYTTSEQKLLGLDIADFLVLEDGLNNNNSLPINKVPSLNRFINEENLQEIPYFQPSPARIIDKEIQSPKKNVGIDLILKGRIFNDLNNNTIEIISTRNFGPCKCSSHTWDEICPYCMYNCTHIIKINGKKQKVEFSQLQVLMMRDS